MSEYVIVGGTGTLGREITRQLLDQFRIQSITILSRDELKQQQMRREFGDYPNLRFMLGDVRDRDSLDRAFRDAWQVFHVAALKHIDVVEANPVEGFKTNVLGTVNVAEAAMAAGCSRVVFSSTDKAVAPINVYGYTKAIGERFILNQNILQETTRFSIFRWGNVLGSRGSVLHHFAETLRKGYVNVTDPSMTRFWIRIEDAVAFMLLSYHKAPADEVQIPPMKAASVMRLAGVMARLMGLREYDVNVIGTRPGEKIHESIAPGLTSDTAKQYTDDELASLIEPVLREVAAA